MTGRINQTRRNLLRSGAAVTLSYSLGSSLSTVQSQTSKPSGYEDWPTYAYDFGNTGYAPENTGPDGKVSVDWVLNTTSSISTQPVIVDNIVYFGTSDGTVCAIDTETLSEVWRFEEPTDYIWRLAVVGNSIYFASSGGYMYAVDVEEGERQWRFEISEHSSTRPVMIGDTVYFNGGEWLYAVDSETGEEMWKFETNETNGDSSPPAAGYGMIYVGHFNSNLYALDHETGEVEWEFTAEYPITRAPIVANNRVYFGEGDTNLYSLDAETGDKRWGIEPGVDNRSHSVVTEDRIHFGDWRNRIRAIDDEKKEEIYSVHLNNLPGHQRPQTHLIIVDEVLYYGDNNRLIALSASTGDLLWRFGVGTYLTPPSVVNGSIYFGTGEGKLYVLSG